MHSEFVVIGTAISNQSTHPVNLPRWRATVQAEAKKRWTRPALSQILKVILINFHKGPKPPLDVDNMSKPILDVMQGVVYEDDRQVRQLEVSHVTIDAPFAIAGVSRMLVTALQAGKPFVYVRVEDVVNLLPLPK